MNKKLKKSMNSFHSKTGTFRGSFWRNLFSIKNDSNPFSKTDIEIFDRTIFRGEKEIINPGRAGSNCHILGEIRGNLLPFMKVYLPSADDIFVGRTLSKEIASLADRTNSYIELSYFYTFFILMLVDARYKYKKHLNEISELSTDQSALNSYRDEFDNLASEHLRMGKDYSALADLSEDVPYEVKISRIVLQDSAESWMLAHEYGHFVEKRGKAQLKTAVNKFTTSMLSVPFMSDEFSKWNSKWAEELRCDFLASQFILVNVWKSENIQELLSGIFLSLEAPVLALLASEKLSSVAAGGSIGAGSEHPHVEVRVNMLILATCKYIFDRIKASLDHRSEFLAVPKIAYFAAGLIEFADWLSSDKTDGERDNVGVDSGPSSRSAREARHKQIYNLIVDLTNNDYSKESLRVAELLLAKGRKL